MRLATREDGTRDGRLIVMSADGARFMHAPATFPTLQSAIDDWSKAEPLLRGIAGEMAKPDVGEPVAGLSFMAPLPRAYQWVDASGYLSHMERVRKARGVAMPPEARTEPVIYQGLSDANLAWNADIPTHSGWGTDLEAEIAVIVGDIPLQSSREQALRGILLVVLVNDISLRSLIPPELAKGFGFFHGKPASAYGAYVATLDEFSSDWANGRLRGNLRIEVNGESLGRLETGVDQDFDFADIIQYATRTRSLGAGSIVGAGTVSNRDESRGVACLAEKRVLEQLNGAPSQSPFLAVGDHISIEFTTTDGREALGAIRQRVVPIAQAVTGST